MITIVFWLLLATVLKANPRKLKSRVNQSSDKSAMMKKSDMIQCVKSGELKNKSHVLHSCIDQLAGIRIEAKQMVPY